LTNREPRQRFNQWKIGLADAVMVEALAVRNHGSMGGSQLFQKGFDERALADAGLAGHKHDLTPARSRLLEPVCKFRELGFPADQSRRLGCGGRRIVLAAVAVLGTAQPASADVITDWNTRAVAFLVSRNVPPPPAERVVAMTQVAMFDAVNSIERKYRPYLVQLPAAATVSKEAAAAAAAGTVLAGVNSQAREEMKAALAAYLAAIPDGAAKTEGVKLGEAVASKILEARTNDGSTAADTYRPRTTAGVYVPTAPTLGSHWPGVKPFAMTSASQFRPAPPIALASADWSANYNEIKDLGGLTSSKRSAKQTEDARFWLATDGRVYYPVIGTLALAKQLSVIDCARLFALTAVARADAR
jgi:hypothetical protein